MGRHWSEDKVRRTVEVFAFDQGMRDFRVKTEGVGPDAVALWKGRTVSFEFKAAASWVSAGPSRGGSRPGRFRIDPNQHEGFGTPFLFYVLISWDRDNGDDGVITQVRILRSDLLPQRKTVISLPAFSTAETD